MVKPKAINCEKVGRFCFAQYWKNSRSAEEHRLNTFKTGDNTINKVSYVYGANGSGKTYFCKILREIQKMIALSPLSMMKNSQLKAMLQNEGLTKQVPGFAFDVKYKDLPTTLGIDLIVDNITYHYEFSMFEQKVVYELLTKNIDVLKKF